MIGLPDLMGRTIDVEEPPYDHQGPGMRCTLWRVFEDHEGIWIESDESYTWCIGPETRITVINPEYQTQDMEWRQQVEEDWSLRRSAFDANHPTPPALRDFGSLNQEIPNE